MAEIVLVHGIGQELSSPDALTADWVLALAGGVLAAGYPELAARLWESGGRIARMAYYGDLFHRTDRLDEDFELTDEQWALAGPLAAEWLRRMAEYGSRELDRAAAGRELAELVVTGERHGMRGLVRPLLRALARIGPFARLGAGLAERVVVGALRQVAVYFTDDRVRSGSQDRVAALVDEDTKIVIGHSLGAVVAYEAVHRTSRPLPLLVTLGSPLGPRTVLYNRVQPQPPAIPAALGRWVNLADTDDIVAAEPHLAGDIPGPPGVLHSDWTDHTGATPHEAAFYLTAPQTGAAIAACLRG